MIIAHEKRNTNIAEYVLYLWQIEDLIRACKFDMNTIKQQLISGYKLEADHYLQVEQWYESLIEMMVREGVTQNGHLQLVKNTIGEITDFHNQLMALDRENEYRHAFMMALPNIDSYRQKSDVQNIGDIEICLNALYGLLLMRLSKREISPDTLEAMKSFSQLLALLSFKFKEWEEGRLKMTDIEQ